MVTEFKLTFLVIFATIVFACITSSSILYSSEMNEFYKIVDTYGGNEERVTKDIWFWLNSNLQVREANKIKK